MKAKKIVSLLLAAAMTVSMAACLRKYIAVGSSLKRSSFHATLSFPLIP